MDPCSQVRSLRPGQGSQGSGGRVALDTVFHGGPRVVAHRGSRLLWPENTSLAFEGAAGLGVDLFETDVRVTADGTLICFHDATLERTTNGSGLTAQTTVDAIRQLDAGYRHRLAGAFPFRNGGCSVPTFEEIVLRFPTAGFIVDLKTAGTEEPLARLILELELQERVIVGSFSDERLRRFRELTAHRVPTSTGTNQTMRAIAAAGFGGRLNPFDRSTVAMQVPVSWYGFPVVTRRLVSLARRWQRLLHCWTINEPGEMERLFDMGIDAVITDRVDLALSPIGRWGSTRAQPGGGGASPTKS